MKDITIAELVEAVGEKNIRFQLLNKCMTDIKECGRGKANKYSKVTFETVEMTPTNFMRGDGKVGLILWIDIDRYNNAIESISADQ
jgi:hypothetical protein